MLARFLRLCFSTFQCDLASGPESGEGAEPPGPRGARLANEDLVPQADESGDKDHQSPTEVSDDAAGSRPSSSTGTQATAQGLQTVLKKFQNHGLSPDVAGFLLKGWRKATRTQYDGTINQWSDYCNAHNISVFAPQIGEVLDFLLHCFTVKNYSYSTLNSVRSALSTLITIDGRPVGQHPLVVRFLRACFNERPALPKKSVTWDANIVLAYLRSISPAHKVPLAKLTQKLTMLLVLLSGQRGQTIHLLDTRNMTLSKSYACFRIGDPVKQSRPGTHINEVAFKAYAPDRRLCVITALTEYLNRTQETRGTTTQLLLTHRPPVHAASRDTIRRWIKSVMVEAGIDLTIFTPHSTRSASTSKAATKLPLTTILETAGWSRASTVTTYYKMEIDKKFDFASAIQ